jgi:hypothetical protein
VALVGKAEWRRCCRMYTITTITTITITSFPLGITHRCSTTLQVISSFVTRAFGILDGYSSFAPSSQIPRSWFIIDHTCRFVHITITRFPLNLFCHFQSCGFVTILSSAIIQALLSFPGHCYSTAESNWAGSLIHTLGYTRWLNLYLSPNSQDFPLKISDH